MGAFSFHFDTATAASKDSTLTYTEYSDIWHSSAYFGDATNWSDNLRILYMNGEIAYCIEPGGSLTTGLVYNSTVGWGNVDLTSAQKRYIELVAYYGYGYSGHSNIRYYMAAADLIWTAIDSRIDTTWTTAGWLQGSTINITSYKNAILELVNAHEDVPSFSGTTRSGRVGETIVLTDANEVLSEFTISGLEHHQATIDGNDLIITLDEEYVGSETLIMKKKVTTSTPTTVYTLSGYQTIFRSGLTEDDVVAELTIYSEGPEEPLEPVKSVNTEEIELGQTFIYTVEHTVEYEDPDLYYDSYVFTDVLDDSLQATKVTVERVKNTSEDAETDDEDTITTDTDTEESIDVTDLFDIKIEGQTVTASATEEALSDADFYDSTYKFNIVVKTKTGYDLTPNKVDDHYEIPNQAEISIDNNSSLSNKVVVIYKPVVVSVPATGANMPLILVGAGILLLAIAGGGYYYVYRRKNG